MKKIDEIKATRNLTVLDEYQDGIMGIWTDPLTAKRYTYVFSWGEGWEHLSVSTPSKTPTWDIMCRFKNMFWNEDETCIEYHPAKEDYVNMHPYCLHIWKPIGIELPKPPTILVGFKD